MTNEELTIKFLQVAEKFQHDIAKLFMGLNLEKLTMVEALYLITIGEAKDVTMKALSEVQNVAAGAATRIVDHLVEKDYVHRFTQEADRRKVFVRLTPNGETLYQKIMKAKQEHIGNILSEKIDEQEREQVSKILDYFIKETTQIY